VAQNWQDCILDDFDLYRLFKTLHVISVTILFGAAMMEGIIGPIVAKSRTVTEVRAYAKLLFISENYLSIPAAISIAVFGYLTADRRGYDLRETWLVLGQVLFYAIVVIALVVLRPAANELYRLARAAPDGPVTPEIVAQLKKPLPAVLGAATGLMFIAIIYLMVAKPAW
jgi:uncharacterized membrane protein